MPKPIKLTNRGPAGLLNKLPKAEVAMDARIVADREAAKKDNIQCDGQVVRLDSLTPDPLNARLHPERNMDAIMDSLCLYGQRAPLVIRQETMVVAAGNGRLEAMRNLGWSVCAVSIRPMTDAEFHGFALADNRTAELARWDFEVVAKVDILIRELGGSRMPGWSMDELEVLRAQSEPVASPDDFPEVGEGLEVEHQCPKCGYQWSGGKVVDSAGAQQRPVRAKSKSGAVVEAAGWTPLNGDYDLFAAVE